MSSGRVIYIINLVTLGPSKPVPTTRVIEHAEKRKRHMKTSRQRASSKAKKQLAAMSTVVGDTRADSAEEGAEAEYKGSEER